MKIGFLVNPNCAISGMSNGVLKQAAMWAEGLRLLGHEVDFIGARHDGSILALKEFDVVHFFQHGHWLKGFWKEAREDKPWFFSPILDSTASVRLYGMLTCYHSVHAHCVVFASARPFLFVAITRKNILRQSHLVQIL